MRGASRLSPARVRHRSSVLSRLLVWLALLYGCGHAVSEETRGGIGETEWAGRIAERVQGTGRAVGGEGGIVVVECDVKVGKRCGEPAEPVTEVGEAASRIEGGAGGVVDDAAELVANVGECSGRRFKKCR